jgi:hypothetical protein
MKFAQEWKQVSGLLPPALHKHCIDYKAWKKYSKREVHDMRIIMSILQQQLQDVNATFEKYYDRCYHRSSCTLFSKRFEKQEVYTFATMNAKCLYKVCKRIDKKYGMQDFMRWYVKERASHTISILGGHKLTRLELDVLPAQKQTISCSCPICLDESPKKLMILECGHTMCADCALDIMGVRDFKGELHNLVAYGRIVMKCNTACPICRHTKAFLNVTPYHVGCPGL